MRIRNLIAALVVLAANAMATTLVQLSMADMISQSTAIVRAKVVGSFGVNHNGNIYTHYQLQVTETLKGSGINDAAIPGGAAGKIRQNVAGAPELLVGSEYVLFLWTSKSGLTQVIGLSQGAFDLRTDATGQPILMRPAVTDPMLDGNGHLVTDRGASMTLSDLRTSVLTQGGK